MFSLTSPFHLRRYARTIFACCLAVLLAASSSTAFYAAAIDGGRPKSPYPKDPLLTIVRSNSIPEAELIARIGERGVRFEMTPEIETEFRGAGATAPMVAAMRANYRPAEAATAAPANSPARPANVPAGPPLTKEAVVELLQNGVTPQRIEQNVQARGVAFQVTPAVAREILAAGGNNSLVGSITAKSLEPQPAVAANNGAPEADVDSRYDDLTVRAIDAGKNDRTNEAIRYLRQAIELDPARTEAYALLGFAQLYELNDATAAEKSMSQAIERGGGAIFRTRHDHGAGEFQQVCEGTLFVTKTNVTYKSDDGNHTFEFPDSTIAEIKMKGPSFSALMSSYNDPEAAKNYAGAYQIRINVEGSKKKKGFNFAPASGRADESQLMIKMVTKYQ